VPAQIQVNIRVAPDRILLGSVRENGQSVGIQTHDPFTPSDVPKENVGNYRQLEQRAEAPGNPAQRKNLGQTGTNWDKLRAAIATVHCALFDLLAQFQTH